MNNIVYEVKKNIAKKKDGFNPVTSEKGYSKVTFEFDADWKKCDILTASFFVSADDIVTSEAQMLENMTASFDVPVRLRNTAGKIFCGVVGTYVDDEGNTVTISTQVITLNALWGLRIVEEAPMNLYEQIIALVNKIDLSKVNLTDYIREINNLTSAIKEQEKVLSVKQLISNMVSDERDVTDESVQYPSLAYLNRYFYSADETYSNIEIDKKLDEKADSTDVDTALANKANKSTVISGFEGNLTFALYSEFFRGQVDSSGTINRNIKYRVTSEIIMQFDYDLIVSVDEGFTGYLVEYENGVCKNNPPTKSLANYNNIISAGTEFRLHIRRTNEITSETANINEFVNAVKFQTKTAAGISKANKDISEISNNLKATDNALMGELPLTWLQGNVPPLGGGAGNRIIAVLGLMTQPFTISWIDENRVVKVWGYDSDTYDNRTKEISVSSGDTITPVQGVYYVIVTRTEDSAVIKPAYGDNVMVNVAFQKIKELDGRIKTIEDNLAAQFVDKPIPDYYYENDYLPNKIKEIREACAVKSGVTFAFITDVHFKDNQKKSKYLLQKILNETNIPFVIYGGDTVSVYGTEAELYEQIAEFNDFKKCIGKDRLFCTRGNHDFYNVTSSTDKTMHSLTTADVYDGLFRDTEHLVTSMSVKNGCYCIDNEVQKTRIIMLNTSDLSSDPDHLGGGILFRGSTLQWLADCLLEKKNYKIIIVCHHHINDDFINSKGEKVKYDFANTSMMDLVSSFVNKEDFITEQNGVSVNVDFANTSNELVCVLSGHRHMDLTSTKNGILNIVTTGDALFQNDGYGRKAGTISEQAFDIVCVNYEYKDEDKNEDKIKIKLIRVGAGKNREFEFKINPSAKVPEDEYYTKAEIDSIVSDITEGTTSPGADGKSAYEVAVENGFSGTESEWLASLKGANGKDGAKGDKGDKGDTGADGQDYVLTAADKQEIANLATDTIPAYVRTAAEAVANKVLSVTGEADTGAGNSSGYTNQLLNATDDNGSPYNNGKGYKPDCRLNSSGVEKNDYTGVCCTGFIPCKAGDVIRFKNITVASSTVTAYIAKYDSSKTFISISSAVNEITENSYTVSGASTAYVRFSFGVISDDSIITVNEEIGEIATGETAKAVVPFNLAFITDLHYTDNQIGRYTSAKKAVNVINETAPIDVEIMGGDYCNNYTATSGGTAVEVRENISKCKKIFSNNRRRLWLRGNHDSNGYPNERLPKAEIYNRIFRSQHTLDGFVENPADPYGCYGYMDFDNAKIRIIAVNTSDNDKFGTKVPEQSNYTAPIINCHNVGSEQLQWIADKALNFSGKTDVNEWGIIFVSHVPLYSSNSWNNSHTYVDDNGASWDCNVINLVNLATAYRDKTSFSATNNGKTASKDFSGDTTHAKILCFISGHTHALISTLYNDFNFISCPNANGGASQSSDGESYTKTAIGTVNETSLSIISVDRTNKKIHAFCYGAGYDREFTY